MSGVKQVKVDNWGIFFLQRLKHFFNRTDYCDLTLQFQDNAQLKVHRLVLSACTEYFELLERTCEMYENCLVMPDDLQADVVVPIVNFMYTGQLEFRMDLLEKLYQTSQIMHMPVLTKLLEAHRHTAVKKPPQFYTPKRKTIDPTPSPGNKRSYTKTFGNSGSLGPKEKKGYTVFKDNEKSPSVASNDISSNKQYKKDPRPTRYELPEELDTDNIYDSSFCDISYTSKPLMIHPETVKRYSSKRSGLFGEATCSKNFFGASSTLEVVQRKRCNSDHIFEDINTHSQVADDSDIFEPSYLTVDDTSKDTNKLFDQILDQNETKVTIDTKNSKGVQNLDHAKIISEVLKKYSHVLKGTKNIKLKILNTPSKNTKTIKSQSFIDEKVTNKDVDYTYETDVIDSQQAAKLIALGAENIEGPWICLICGTPGRALHFTSYYKFRRHLIEVHKEKPIANMCEYCGHKSLKRNYLLHHLYAKHDVPPPPKYNFPKCNLCNYIALTEGMLIKHKMSHSGAGFRCNVCVKQFPTSNSLLQHIQKTGHKYCAERKKNNLQCIYCLKVFTRESNLFTHLKSYHKAEAKSDGVIEDSDEELDSKESQINMKNDNNYELELEPMVKNEFEEVQYQIQPDGNIQFISNKKQNTNPIKQKILNSGLVSTASPVKSKTNEDTKCHNDFIVDRNIPALEDNNEDEIVTIDDKEYIVRNNQLISKLKKQSTGMEFIIPEYVDSNHVIQTTTSSSIEVTNTDDSNIIENTRDPNMIVSNTSTLNQPIQFVVSSEEEYKAFMSTNHPIIFNNGNNNKTLAVLTAPPGTTLDTAAINLDNTQTNDMMIIQEPFNPLNVTENVTTENSNIVVVYSHPVDNQNKQYQLITTQGLGAQFVPSSAIMTQNYETVSTTAPIMSAHVLGTEEAWESEVVHQPTNDHQSQLPAEVSEMQPKDQIVLQANIPDNSVSELPEAHLNQNQEEPVSTPNTNKNNDEINKPTHTAVDVEITNTEQQNTDNAVIEENTPETKSEPIDTLPLNLPAVEINDAKETENTLSETLVNVPEENNSEKMNEIITNTEPEPTKSPDNDEHATENAENIEEPPSPTSTQDKEVTGAVQIKYQQETNDQRPEGQSLTNGTLEQIQNLTSEWSEDDGESQDKDDEETKTNELETVDSETVIEESIENIQQEMEKQNSVPSTPPEIPDAPIEDTHEINTPDTKTETNNDRTDEIASNEKISSLLNDWEDSQETNEQPSEEKYSSQESQNEVKEDQLKPGIIKKLVSDWEDDDDDENKE